jgi:hypothetical protein
MQPRVFARTGVLVDSEIASEKTGSVINGGLGDGPPSRDRTKRQPTVRLGKTASLTAITLLSVGLWVVIWTAAGSLAAVWLR